MAASLPNEAAWPSIQLVSGSGTFNREPLDNFVTAVRLPDAGLSYAVVAIIGPQSSGKSTLLNQLFGTRFQEMDFLKGRQQTTQGIWLAAARHMQPLTLVMDIEGTDSRERGEDDTTFEKQSALFALAAADVIIVNMWCHDIGREHASNKPLLRTVFQAILRLFSPRKATLLFVIRDKTRTPMETLEGILRDDIQKTWDSVPRAAQGPAPPLSEFFNVLVTSLPNFEERESEFKEQVAALRLRFSRSLEAGGMACDRRGAVPAAGLALSLAELWRVVGENRDLDLPAHKVMVATVRCEQIAAEAFSDFTANETWRGQCEAATSAPAECSNFGAQVGTLAAACLARYDSEAAFFEASVRQSKRQLLSRQLAEAVLPAFSALLSAAASRGLAAFAARLEAATGGPQGSAARFAASAADCRQRALEEFEAAAAGAVVAVLAGECRGAAAEARERFKRQLDQHEAAAKEAKLKAIQGDCQSFLAASLLEPTAALLEAGSPSSWAEVRSLLLSRVAQAQADLRAALAGFALPAEAARQAEAAVARAGRSLVEGRARELSGQALALVKERFLAVFSHDSRGLPRQWLPSSPLERVVEEARRAALQLLAVLAVLRLDGSATPAVDAALEALLQPPAPASADALAPHAAASSAAASEATADKRSGGSGALQLASSTWEGVPQEHTLLSPPQCRALWAKLRAETQYAVLQAMQAQQNARHGASWLPPPWALLAIALLGFNEFMWLLRSPVTLVLLLVAFLFGRAVVAQMDVAAIFEHGLVPGLVLFLTRVLPAASRVAERLIREGQQQWQQRSGAAGLQGSAVGSGQSGAGVALQDFSSGSSGSSSVVEESSSRKKLD